MNPKRFTYSLLSFIVTLGQYPQSERRQKTEHSFEVINASRCSYCFSPVILTPTLTRGSLALNQNIKPYDVCARGPDPHH